MITRNDIVEYINRPGIPMKVISEPERYGQKTVVVCIHKKTTKGKEYDYNLYDVNALRRIDAKLPPAK